MIQTSSSVPRPLLPTSPMRDRRSPFCGEIFRRARYRKETIHVPSRKPHVEPHDAKTKIAGTQVSVQYSVSSSTNPAWGP